MATVSFNFAGEVVLVTGGSRGLGFEIAQAFGKAGATVVMTARREQWLKEAETTLREQGITAHALLCDVADQTAVERVVEHVLSLCGTIDVLVNNAGLTWGTPAEDMPLERWRQVIEANMTFRALARRKPSVSTVGKTIGGFSPCIIVDFVV